MPTRRAATSAAYARRLVAAAPQKVLAGRAALRDAAARALQEFQTARLTTVMRLSGRAMAPTLNPGARAPPPAAGADTETPWTWRWTTRGAR